MHSMSGEEDVDTLPMDAELDPKDRGRKCEQVLAGARQVFMREGFQCASVDEIARAAGVSKATLYNYFPEKRDLFAAVIMAECARQADGIEAISSTDAPVEEVLYSAAIRFVTFKTSHLGQQIFRICVAEADRFPELAQVFYETGPDLIRSRLIEFFKDRIAKGELVIDDLDLAAHQFAELCKARLFYKRVFGMNDVPAIGEIAVIAEEAVRTFLARYGTKEHE